MAVPWLNSGIGGHQTGQAANPYTTGGWLDPQQWQQLPAYAQNDRNGYTLYRNMQTGQIRGSRGTVGSEGFSLAEFAGNPAPTQVQPLPGPLPGFGGGAQAPQPLDLSPLLNALGGSGQGTGANPQYTSGIQAGNIYSPAQQSAAVHSVATGGARMPNVYGVAQAPGQQGQLNNLMSQFGQRNATNLDRGISAANAQQLLASQTARAQSGVSGGNLLQQMYDMNLRNQLAQQQPLLALLSKLTSL